MNIKVNLADGTPAQFKTEIIDGAIVVTIVEDEKQDTNLFPKWEDLEFVKGYYVNQNSEISEFMTLSAVEDAYNLFSTSDLAKASLATARVSQTYRRYRELVDGSPMSPIFREYGLLRMAFVSLSDWDNFFDANEEDFKLILNAANNIQL